MSISMIVAHDSKRAIGKGNQIPWHIPDDLKFFKTMTIGKTIVMGRKTFESMGCKPLPNRRNIVLSRSVDKLYKNVIQFDTASRISEMSKTDEIFIIGGAELYAQFINLADKMYVTEIHKDIGGDVFFPPIDENRFMLASTWSNVHNDLEYDVNVYLKR